jgi:hypothetical protein
VAQFVNRKREMEMEETGEKDKSQAVPVRSCGSSRGVAERSLSRYRPPLTIGRSRIGGEPTLSRTCRTETDLAKGKRMRACMLQQASKHPSSRKQQQQ